MQPFRAGVRILLLLCDIRSTHLGHEHSPLVKPLLRRVLEMRGQIARDRWWD